jgi:DNA-binding SARP family transcriptional activator
VLRTYISRIRAALPQDFPGSFLITLDGAYLANPPHGALDLDRFRKLLADASDALALDDRQEAARLLRRALACWKSPPGSDFLPDLPDTPEVAPQAARLGEERRQAELRLTDLQLELGEYEEILPDLTARVHAQPGSERTWAQLMHALHRSGRQAEALDAYHKAKAILADQYGTIPGADLQSALMAILSPGERTRPARSYPGMLCVRRPPRGHG